MPSDLNVPLADPHTEADELADGLPDPGSTLSSSPRVSGSTSRITATPWKGFEADDVELQPALQFMSLPASLVEGEHPSTLFSHSESGPQSPLPSPVSPPLMKNNLRNGWTSSGASESWKVRAHSSSSTSTLPSAFASTVSLPLSVETAKSSHGYIQGLPKKKLKLKSRPNYGNLASSSGEGGFFSMFGRKKDKEEEETEAPKENKPNWYSKLKKRTHGHVHQLLGADGGQGESMEWGDLLKVMRETGFTYNQSAAGSRVTFDYSEPGYRSITLDKPHPKQTLTSQQVKDIGKKLKKYYGWSEDNFRKAFDA